MMMRVRDGRRATDELAADEEAVRAERRAEGGDGRAGKDEGRRNEGRAVRAALDERERRGGGGRERSAAFGARVA